VGLLHRRFSGTVDEHSVRLGDMGMPFGYPRISIPGPAHYGTGQVKGLDKMT
jgi:hypothetical protein